MNDVGEWLIANYTHAQRNPEARGQLKQKYGRALFKGVQAVLQSQSTVLQKKLSLPRVAVAILFAEPQPQDHS